jgi:DNA-binding transcriptional ArsR family regulator
VLNQDSLDRVFHALSDPSRRAMVERLSRGPASVSELAQPFGLSLPAIVQHLQVLESSGLVRSEKVGRVRTCRIEPSGLRSVEEWISERRSSWERRLDRLGDFLIEVDPRRAAPDAARSSSADAAADGAAGSSVAESRAVRKKPRKTRA